MKTEKHEQRNGIPVQSQLKVCWLCAGTQAEKCKTENKIRVSGIDNNNHYQLKIAEEEYRKCMNTC